MMRLHHLRRSCWILFLIISIALSSSHFGEEAKLRSQHRPQWELSCGEHFKIASFSGEKHHRDINPYDFEAYHAIHLTVPDATIILSGTFEFAVLERCAEESCSLSETEFRNKTGIFSITLSDESGEAQSNIKYQQQRSYSVNHPHTDIAVLYEISDDLDETHPTIFHWKDQQTPIFKDFEHSDQELQFSESSIASLEIPELDLLLNLTYDTEGFPVRMNLLGNISSSNVQIGTMHILIQSWSDADLVDDLYGNEKVTNIRKNAMKSIIVGQEVPQLQKSRAVLFTIDTDKLRFHSNLTEANINTEYSENWLFQEMESVIRPELNYFWSGLKTTQRNSGDTWQAQLGKFSFGRLAVKGDLEDGNLKNYVLSFYLNSGFPISKAVLKLDWVNLTFLDLILDSAENEWNFQINKTGNPNGYSFKLTESSFWTHHKNPITIFNLIQSDLKFSAIASKLDYKMIFSRLKNFRNLFKNLNVPWNQITELSQPFLKENFLLSEGLHQFFELFGGVLQDKLQEKINHLESLLRKSSKLIVKSLRALVEENKLDFNDVLLKAIERLEGIYLEEKDTIPETLLQLICQTCHCNI